MTAVWRLTTRVLLIYQALIALIPIGLGSWLTVATIGCQSCDLAGPFMALLGLTWAVGGAICAVILISLVVWGCRSCSKRLLVITLVAEALLTWPAAMFHDVMRPFGLPEIGLYLVGAAITAAVVIVLLSGLSLLMAGDRFAGKALPIAAMVIALPFIAAGIGPVTTAYSSAQIGPDGLPVGPVTAEFIQQRAKTLPLRYPGTTLIDSRASAEEKVFNRYQMASARLMLRVEGREADEQAWYQSSLASNGWMAIQCAPGGCQDFMTVFRRGTRECISLLISGDGVAQIEVNYQIAPSGWPFTGDPTTDHRRCTNQY
jgi:hypothetical protein